MMMIYKRCMQTKHSFSYPWNGISMGKKSQNIKQKLIRYTFSREIWKNTRVSLIKRNLRKQWHERMELATCCIGIDGEVCALHTIQQPSGIINAYSWKYNCPQMKYVNEIHIFQCCTFKTLYGFWTLISYLSN